MLVKLISSNIRLLKKPGKQRGTKVIANGQISLWDDDAGNGFDENARLTIVKVTGKESSIITKKVNNFTAGFYPKAIGEYAQHTYGSAFNWSDLHLPMWVILLWLVVVVLVLSSEQNSKRWLVLVVILITQSILSLQLSTLAKTMLR